jgi:hypothetical protein
MRFLPLGGMCVAPAAPAGQRPKRRDRRSIDEDIEEADMPLVGIGHLTMLDTAPPDWVSLAHDAGGGPGRQFHQRHGRRS